MISQVELELQMLSCASGSRRASNSNELCSMDVGPRDLQRDTEALAFLLKPSGIP